MTVDRAGLEQAYMSKAQVNLWSWFQRADFVIPVTGRSPEQLARTDLKFMGPRVLLQGAVLTDDRGQEDESWGLRVREMSLQMASELMVVEKRVLGVASELGLQVSVVSHNQVPLYLALKARGRPEAALQPLTSRVLPLVPASWRVRSDTSELLILPPHLGKERAVRQVINQFEVEKTLFVGVGHSDADTPFMELCHVSVRPNEWLVPGGVR